MPKRRTRKGPVGPESEDRVWADYSQRFRTEVMPQLMSSAVFLAIYDDADSGGDQEIRFATCLGMMLLYNRPIILTVVPGSTVPERLARVADEIVQLDVHDPVSQDNLADALQRLRPR